LLAALGVGSFASLAAAQPSSGAILAYGPLANAVPTVGGTLLIVLSVLLMFVAFRLLKHRTQSGTQLFVAVLAVGALATGAGGVKLVADAYAAAATEMTNPNGGVLTLPPGVSLVSNATDVRQHILSIQYLGGCSNQPNAKGAQLEAPPPAGTCSTSTSLAPQSTEYCEIEVVCPKTCAFAWNPNFYVDFTNSEFVGSGNYWSDPACTIPNGNLSRKWVYSPSGQANANGLCVTYMGAGFVAIPSNGPLVFECVI